VFLPVLPLKKGSAVVPGIVGVDEKKIVVETLHFGISVRMLELRQAAGVHPLAQLR
jgi:hypothetical protein